QRRCSGGSASTRRRRSPTNWAVPFGSPRGLPSRRCSTDSQSTLRCLRGRGGCPERGQLDPPACAGRVKRRLPQEPVAARLFGRRVNSPAPSPRPAEIPPLALVAPVMPFRAVRGALRVRPHGPLDGALTEPERAAFPVGRQIEHGLPVGPGRVAGEVLADGAG